MKDAESQLEFILVEKQRGGKDGGHSKLTKEAENLIAAFDELRDDIDCI